MKKMLCVMFALVLILSLTVSSAMAGQFTLNGVQCTTVTDQPSAKTSLGWDSGDHSGKMYVYHTVTRGSNSYTNYFRGWNGSSYIGAKWITPGSNTPIESSLFVPDSLYGVATRGNTKHNEINGLVTIDMTGSYGWPL